MTSLSHYIDVEDTALAVLRARGFQVWRDERSSTICAEKRGWDFQADDACSLLGVTAIFETIDPEHWGEYWWRIVEPGARLTDSLPTAPERPYHTVVPGGGDPTSEAPTVDLHWAPARLARAEIEKVIQHLAETYELARRSPTAIGLRLKDDTRHNDATRDFDVIFAAGVHVCARGTSSVDRYELLDRIETLMREMGHDESFDRT